MSKYIRVLMTLMATFAASSTNACEDIGRWIKSTINGPGVMKVDQCIYSMDRTKFLLLHTDGSLVAYSGGTPIGRYSLQYGPADWTFAVMQDGVVGVWQNLYKAGEQRVYSYRFGDNSDGEWHVVIMNSGVVKACTNGDNPAAGKCYPIRPCQRGGSDDGHLYCKGQ